MSTSFQQLCSQALKACRDLLLSPPKILGQCTVQHRAQPCGCVQPRKSGVYTNANYAVKGEELTRYSSLCKLCERRQHKQQNLAAPRAAKVCVTANHNQSMTAWCKQSENRSRGDAVAPVQHRGRTQLQAHQHSNIAYCMLLPSLPVHWS